MWHNDAICIMLYHIELLHALIVLVLRLYYTILVLYLQAKSHFPCHSHLQELLSMIPCALATVNQSTIVNPSSEGTCDISETDPKCHLLNPDGKHFLSRFFPHDTWEPRKWILIRCCFEEQSHQWNLSSLRPPQHSIEQVGGDQTIQNRCC